MRTIIERLDAIRATAIVNGVPVRRKDGRLYTLLADCLTLCEEVLRDNLEPELREAVRVTVDARNPEIWGSGRTQSNNGKGRRFAMANADAFLLVSRYVLTDLDNRNSHYRYALTLREAANRQIKGSDLAYWLSNNGGVNALYIPGGKRAETRNTKHLYLNQAVRFPATGTFTLILEHDGKGYFNVMNISKGE